MGTKYAAMMSVQHLTNFREADTSSEQDTELAEKYFVEVRAGARSRTTEEMFGAIRELFMQVLE